MTKSQNMRKQRQLIAKQWLDTKLINSKAYTDLLTTLCCEVRSPFSLAVLIAVRSEDWPSVLQLSKSVNPLSYHDSMSYFKDCQIASLIKKYKALPIDVDPKIECAKKFISAELQCRKTNEYFRSGEFYRSDVRCDIMHRAKSIVSRILGDVDDVDLTEVQFGTGRTFGVKRNVSAFYKLNGPLEVTSKCFKLASNLLAANPGWVNPFNTDPSCCIPSLLKVCPGDLYSSVDKDASTDRPLGIPPLLNAVLAKCVGSHLKSRYKRLTGIDISTAQYTHKRVVQAASITGTVATIDLSSASDTISYQLVMELLPFEWFDLLDKIRSECYSVKDNSRPDSDAKWYAYEKFTAMGCGFTFELESIIFYAITKACMDYENQSGFLSVYGDDILLPQQSYALVANILPHFGFEVNLTKSFSTGYFRESCGSDFFSGVDVRPFYLKDEICPRVLCLWHNTWVRKGYRYAFPRTYTTLRKYIPRNIFHCLRAPLGADGDEFLIDEALPSGMAHYSVVITQKYNNIIDNDLGLLPLIMYRIDRCNHDYLSGRKGRLPIKVLDSTTPIKFLYINKGSDSTDVDACYWQLPGRDSEQAAKQMLHDRNKRPCTPVGISLKTRYY